MMHWLESTLPHLIAVPILLPLLFAGVMLFLGDRRRQWKALLNVLACIANLVVACALLVSVDGEDGAGAVGVYLIANWEMPLGIGLAVDRLSAMMLVLTAIIGVCAVFFSMTRWHRAGVHFHPLFQIQLMGLNGAFLTTDLFNLFVFFEVMLAASYGLLLHGTGLPRVRAGLHYIAVNLLASSLFLVGVAMLYGLTGTLNMADMAQKLQWVPAADRGLLQAGVGILMLAFLTKAALWPLNFWLTPAYAAASAPAAALFAIMTKVGVYAVLRVSTLFVPADQAASFGVDVLIWGGVATLVFGAVGLLASRQLGRLAGFSVIVSSGTLLATMGFGQSALTGSALYYLLSSTLAASALFLLIELIERARRPDAVMPVVDDAEEGDEIVPFVTGPDPATALYNLDDAEQVLIGRAIPAAMAFLGLSFVVCTLLLAGMPPLSGFVAKFTMLSELLARTDAQTAPGLSSAAWTMFGLLIGSGLLSLMALSRAGVAHFWAPQDRPPPRLRVIECLPIVLLLGLCIGLTMQADAALRYTRAAAEALYQSHHYIDSVLSARPVPKPASTPGAAP